jgi:hypothetical protein
VLTAPYYRNFLSNELPLYLQDAPLATQGRMWLEHHRTPPHFSREVMEFFNKNHEDGTKETDLAQLVTTLETIRFLSVGLKELKSGSQW